MLILFGACGNSSDESYIQEVKNKDGKYILQKVEDELQMTMSLLPPRYMALKEKYDEEENATFNTDSLTAVYENYLNLTFTLGIEGASNFLEAVVSDIVEYQDLVQYLSYGIQKDLILCTTKDTLQVHFVHFERDYGLTPNANIQLGFNLPEDIRRSINRNDFSIGFNARHFGMNSYYFHYESDLL